jgi:hypothetical protein
MRLWTLHPQYLDRQGLLAAWREALLARKVLSGATRGYRKHPQLIRFSESQQPLIAIELFLYGIFQEAKRRHYRFSPALVTKPATAITIDETEGQLLYEWRHLKRKLERRSPEQFAKVNPIVNPQSHPLFRIIPGEIRSWEIVNEK